VRLKLRPILRKAENIRIEFSVLGEASYSHAHCDLRDAIMSGRHESNTVPVGIAQEGAFRYTLWR
jgi:hypothetical protein